MNENLQLDGNLYEYGESGNLIREIQYADGLMDGRYFTYFETGAVQSIHFYQDGIPEGHFLWYFPDGAVQQKGVKVNGDTEGRVESYFPDGQLQSFFHFHHGKKNGLAVEYYPTNAVKVHSWYDEAGKLVFQKAYNQNGKQEEQFGEPLIISSQEVDQEKKTIACTIALGFPQEFIEDFSVRCIFPDKIVKKIPVVPGPNGTIEYEFPFLDGMAFGQYLFVIELSVNLPSEKEPKKYQKRIQAILENDIRIRAI